MKDYTRLTDRDDSLCVDCVDIGFCRKTCIMQARYERLQFLENEIESGKIVDRNDYLDYLLAAKNTLELTDMEIEFFAKHNARVRAYVNAEIARLTAENSELRARLDKAVELPVPLETPILKVWKNRVPEDDARMSFVDTWEITTINFKLEHYPLWGKFYFPNTEEGKKAAEARLKEMKEKNNG